MNKFTNLERINNRKFINKINHFDEKNNNRISNKHIKNLIIANIIFAMIFFLLKYIITKFPDIVEYAYSQNIYQWLTTISVSWSKYIPFAFMEIIAYLLVAYLIILFLKVIFFLIRHEYKRSEVLGLQLILIIIINLFLYQFLWGLNQYRYSVEDLFGIQEIAINEEDLIETYSWLVNQANESQKVLESTIPDYKDYTYEDIRNRVDDGYQRLSDNYKFISSREAVIKPLLISPYFSRSGYSGIYLYLFSEPTINTMPPIISLPFTASHEMAHQQGFASEDDANFVGFLASINNNNPLFQYSGYLAALNYVGNALYKTNELAYHDIRKQLSQEVIEDMLTKSQFWAEHEVESSRELHNSVNDAFLKANNQPDGIINYSNVARLLVEAYTQGQLIYE